MRHIKRHLFARRNKRTENKELEDLKRQVSWIITRKHGYIRTAWGK